MAALLSVPPSTSCFTRTPTSELSFRRSVSYMPPSRLTVNALRPGTLTLISVPRPLQSLKFDCKKTTRICCIAKGENRPAPPVVAEDGAFTPADSKKPPSYYFYFSEGDLASEENLWKLYQRWMLHFNVNRDLAENMRRFPIFKENVYRIDRHNRQRAGSTWALDRYADLTEDPRLCKDGVLTRGLIHLLLNPEQRKAFVQRLFVHGKSYAPLLTLLTRE